MTVTNSTLSGNSANCSNGSGGGGWGGGIYNAGGLVTVTASTLSGNSAHGCFRQDSYGGSGAGIFNSGTLAVTDSTLSGNSTSCSGIVGGGVGGGIANGGTLTVTNSTLSGNSASCSMGGTYGGGIIVNGGTLTMTNSTLSGNSANNGGGIVTAGGTLNYSNTIIANSVNGDCVNIIGGGIGANTANLVEDGSCAASLSVDPLLGALANNGGLTQTLALLAGSPAINAATNAGCPATDQRGVTRPQPSGGACDLGAYEFVFTPTTTTLGANPSPAVYSQTVALTATVNPTAATGSMIFQEGGSALTCSEGTQPRALSGGSATCTVTGGFGVGPHAFTADYSGDSTYASSQGTTSLTVNKANTTTTITSDTPDPSAVNGTVPVNYAVAVVAPGAGTPTGNVTVSDGAGTQCTAPVATGSCTLAFATPGTKNLTASYAGADNFNGSTSVSEPHTVLVTTAQGDGGGGTVKAAITGGTCVGFAAGTPSFTAAPTPLPSGVAFPYGVFGFTAVCPPQGGTLILTMTYPNPLPPGTQYWKYGPEPPPGDPNPHWYVLPATITDNTAVFTITDGGLGDDDLAADGDIVDQGGPGVPGAGDEATGIPTLSEWALLVFSVLLGGLVWRGRRRVG